MQHARRVFVIGLAIALAPLAALAQSQTRPGSNAATYNHQLQIGPVPGLTTAWYPAPTKTAVPLGVTLQFKAKGQRAGTVEWTGARELGRGRGLSTAECHLNTPGPHTVTMEYTDGNGEPRREVSALIVIDTSVFPIHISIPKPWTDSLQIDETSSNESTMRYFFGHSIAKLRKVGEGHYLTSTNRWFHLQVTVEPSGFAPLLEWRVNGKAQEHLGTDIMMQVFPPRQHEIEAGSPENARAIKLETYRVQVTSHTPRVDNIPEGSPVTFTAVTDPPGYEDEITWLASTKYGACEPLMGQGPEFTVTFRNTFGANGRWLGAKADNAVFANDTKDICPPGFSKPPGFTVCTPDNFAIAFNNEFCDAAQGLAFMVPDGHLDTAFTKTCINQVFAKPQWNCSPSEGTCLCYNTEGCDLVAAFCAEGESVDPGQSSGPTGIGAGCDPPSSGPVEP